MFFLAFIKESVKIEPKRLRGDFIETIKFVLNTKYCNKVASSWRVTDSSPSEDRS